MRHENFSILKINGTTAFFNYETKSYSHIPQTFQEKSEFELIQDLINLYGNTVHASNRYSNTLTFAWEYPTSIYKQTVVTAIAAVKEAVALVVIGYSFPFFNREIDRKLFESISPRAKIYVQDKKPGNVEARIDAYKKSTQVVSIVSDIDQFFLPPEL